MMIAHTRPNYRKEGPCSHRREARANFDLLKFQAWPWEKIDILQDMNMETIIEKYNIEIDYHKAAWISKTIARKIS